MPDLRKLTTEKRNSATMKLDEMTPYEIISIMNREDHNVIEAVHRHCRILKLLFCGHRKLTPWRQDYLYRSRNQRASGSVGCCRMSAYLWRTI